MPDTIKSLTDVQCKKLLNVIRTDHKTDMQKLRGIRNFLMTCLMLDAGLRVGELVMLEIDDLYFAGRSRDAVIVRSEIAKNHKERTVPLTTRIIQSVQMMQQWNWHTQPDYCKKYAFYNSNTEFPIGIRLVQKMVGEASLKALGVRVHPHMLRHTFATRLMRTTNASIVQALLGHSNLNSTQVYTHPNSDDLTNAIRGLDGTPENQKS